MEYTGAHLGGLRGASAVVVRSTSACAVRPSCRSAWLLPADRPSTRSLLGPVGDQRAVSGGAVSRSARQPRSSSPRARSRTPRMGEETAQRVAGTFCAALVASPGAKMGVTTGPRRVVLSRAASPSSATATPAPRAVDAASTVTDRAVEKTPLVIMFFSTSRPGRDHAPHPVRRAARRTAATNGSPVTALGSTEPDGAGTHLAHRTATVATARPHGRTDDGNEAALRLERGGGHRRGCLRHRPGHGVRAPPGPHDQASPRPRRTAPATEPQADPHRVSCGSPLTYLDRRPPCSSGTASRCAAVRSMGPVSLRRRAVTHAAVVRNVLGLRPLWRLKAVLKPKASA